MTLHDVEAVTRGEFKAASLSAYERGERAISVLRLLRIAQVYKAGLDELIPPLEPLGPGSLALVGSADPAPGESEMAPGRATVEPISALRLRLDVERLAEVCGPGWDQLRNVVAAIQLRRRGRPGRYVLLRGEDIWIVAAIFGTTPHEVVPILTGEGLVHPA